MRSLLVVAVCVLGFAQHAAADVRIKDITSLVGVRDNQLVGYGLVVGLQGTGDSLQNAPFTDQATQSMLERMGLSLRGAKMRTRNLAAIIATADLPPYAVPGTRIDVSIASLGDASSLMGGTLVMTPLSGPDGVTYAVAQGALAVSGFAASGQSQALTQGVPTAARVPNGAIVERQVSGGMRLPRNLVFQLRNPDYQTSLRIADAINKYSRERFGRAIAQTAGPSFVKVNEVPRNGPDRLLADIGELRIEPDVPARVVVDERTGTIVIGQDVRISTVAVTQGDLTVRVTEIPNVSQPLPFSGGTTKVTSQTDIAARQDGGHVAVLSGTSLRTLVAGLNQIGLKPAGIIAILQAIKSAGALQAEFVVE